MSRLRVILQKLRGGPLRQGTAILGSGAALSLVIAYVTQIVLTRLFSAADFGVADSFISLVAIMAPIASLRYEDAIVLPESSRESRSILQLAAVLILSFSVVILLVMLPFGSFIGRQLGSELLGTYLPFLPLALLLHRSNELLELWHSRNKAFAQISRAQVARSVVTASTRLSAGFSGFLADAGGLIVGFIAGFFASVIIMIRGNVISTVSLFHGGSLRKARFVAQRYIRFPMFSMPANLLSTLNGRLPFLLLLFFFTEDVVGYFGRAFVAVAIPLSLVGTAVSRVFFVAASERVREQSLSALTLAVYDRLVSIAVIPIVALLIAGPQLFAAVFGEEWTEAGNYARILAPWFAFIGVASPLTRLFDVLERQKLDFLISGISFAVVSVVLIVGGLTGSVDTVLRSLSIAGCATRIFQIVVLLRLGGLHSQRILTPWLKYALATSPLAALLIATSSASTIWLLSGLIVGLIIYGITLIVLQLREGPRDGS